MHIIIELNFNKEFKRLLLVKNEKLPSCKQREKEHKKM